MLTLKMIQKKQQDNPVEIGDEINLIAPTIPSNTSITSDITIGTAAVTKVEITTGNDFLLFLFIIIYFFLLLIRYINFIKLEFNVLIIVI